MMEKIEKPSRMHKTKKNNKISFTIQIISQTFTAVEVSI